MGDAKTAVGAAGDEDEDEDEEEEAEEEEEDWKSEPRPPLPTPSMKPSSTVGRSALGPSFASSRLRTQRRTTKACVPPVTSTWWSSDKTRAKSRSLSLLQPRGAPDRV